MNKVNKNKVSVTVNWKYNQQANPAFSRLMGELLNPKKDTKAEIEIKDGDEENAPSKL